MAIQAKDKLVKLGQLKTFLTKFKAYLNDGLGKDANLTVNYSTGELEYDKGTFYTFEVDHKTGELKYKITI